MQLTPRNIIGFVFIVLVILAIGCGGGTAGLPKTAAQATAVYTTAGYTETSSGFTVDAVHRNGMASSSSVSIR
jgi:hypothetical protein